MADVAAAPALMRRTAISPSAAEKPLTLYHINADATADDAADSHASTRTLTHAGDWVDDQLYSLVEDEGHTQLLLNFGNVQYLSSAALGKLINLKKKVGAVRGKLKLCCIHPDLLEVFKITRLDQVFEIYAEEQQALDRF